jgi:uncharacterized surface protein with fasciclin (FAS1) repeats
MHRRVLIALGAVSALVLATAACSQPPAAETAQIPVAEAIPSPAADIVDTAVGAGQFTTLAAALTAADLITTLKGAGPFTVFAPTDAAFAKLPAGTVDDLLKPENKAKLTAVLTYHVVSGKVMSSALAGKVTDAPTVQGQTVKVDATGGGVMVNDATVTGADVEASNGVIHVIDTVLLPG